MTDGAIKSKGMLIGIGIARTAKERTESMTEYEAAKLIVEMATELRSVSAYEPCYNEAVAIACHALLSSVKDGESDV